VQSLERGLAVICAFDANTPALTLSDVARRTGLTRAAARRFLLTLADLNYVQSDGRYFRLTPRVLNLGYSFLSSFSLPAVALPYLEKLVAVVEESSEASILDGEDIVYILRIPGPRIVTVAVNVGGRMPAHATSMGRVLLANLDDAALERYVATAELRKFLPNTTTSRVQLREELMRVRQQGYAIIDAELEEGLRAVAVPIHDRSGDVIAAANLSTHAARRSLESLRNELLPALQRAVVDIENDLRSVAVRVESSRA
jgi:IclR family pca regulon transcriptional regulator